MTKVIIKVTIMMTKVIKVTINDKSDNNNVNNDGKSYNKSDNYDGQNPQKMQI